uniref:E3 SUMO-protein ligase RanBP2 n=1 Tax=Glossina brevipalpis TaxID=37001 RepID=A0A1A9WNS8_9MUSC
MNKTKKDVDAKVRVALNKLRSESERNLRGFRIAKLYYNINELTTAEQYLCSYLNVKKDDADAHKLLGQIYKRLKKRDKALEAFQHSLQLNTKQPNVLIEVCQLLLEDENISCKKAKFWCDLAESEHVQHDAVLTLRLKLTKQSSLENDQTEALLQKEITACPNYVQLRIYLVRYYIDQNQIFNAFQYVHQVEKLQIDEFINSHEWYNIVWLVLSKYEQLPTAKKDWDFWFLLINCLERQVQISFTIKNGTDSTLNGLIETTNFLFNLDQYLFKFSQIHEMLCAQKELVELLLHHYRGQFLLHTIALIFKRELLLNKQRWRETARIVLPLLLLAYQVQPRQNKEPWMKHCDEHGMRLIILWQREGSFRCAQAGRTLLSYMNARTTTDKVKSSQHNDDNVFGNQTSSKGTDNCDLLAQIRKTCSDGQWRRNVFASLYCNSDQKVMEQSSLLIKCSKFHEPLYDLPSTADVERYEEDAQFLRPQSLKYAIYLCLGNDNLSSVRALYFSGLNFSTQNLELCSAESLNQLDVDSFMYAAAIQAKRSLEVQCEVSENYLSGDSNVIGKPSILPFVLLETQLCSDNQAEWWNAAYKVYKNLSNGTDLAELRGILQYGIEAIRGVNGPKFDMAIVFKLGQILVERANGNVKHVEKLLLEARAESIYKYGLKLLKMHKKGLLDGVPKYFTYAKFQDVEKDLINSAEDAASYLAGRYFKRAEYEDLIEELTGLQLPFASYWQAEAYRKLYEASQATRKIKDLYMEKAGECLNQSLTFLKSPNVNPDHRLNSIVQDEIKRLHHSAASHQNESPTGNYCSPQTNSSMYHDAEDGFYRETFGTPLSELGNSNRTRWHTPPANATFRVTDNTTESLIKQMSSTLILLKEEITENLRPEIQRASKEIVLMKEKISNLEEVLKAARISSNPPSRDETLNILDDFYVIEEALQQQMCQQQQSSQAITNSGLNSLVVNNPFVGEQPRLQTPTPLHIQTNAFNNPMIQQSANYPINFYGHNQSNAYLMPIVPTPMVAHNGVLLPTTTTLQSNKPLNNQLVEKSPPANVVITNSDPLPNTNIVNLVESQQQPTLSVTIPPHHLKVNTAANQQSLDSGGGNVLQMFNKKSTTVTVTSAPLSTGFQFSFKPPIITTPTVSTTCTGEEQNKVIANSGSDLNKLSTNQQQTECNPRSVLKTIEPNDTVSHTTEKDEEIIFCYRAKLLSYVDKEWKERGIGDIKILKNNEERIYRILMKQDQTNKICVNHKITSELLLTTPQNETKGFVWVANDFAGGDMVRLEKFFIRFETSEIARKFEETFKRAQQQELIKSNTKTPMTNVNVQAKSTYPIFTSSVTGCASESNISGSNSLFVTTVEASSLPSNTFSSINNFKFGKSMTTNINTTIDSFSPASPFASIFNNLSNSANTTPLGGGVDKAMPTNVTLAPTNTSDNAFKPFVNNENAINNLLVKSSAIDAEEFQTIIPLLPDSNEISTNEINEIILFDQRAHLLCYNKEVNELKEKGVGNIKLMQDKSDVNKLRLTMQREQDHNYCCNQYVYKNTIFKNVKNSQVALSWIGHDFSENEAIMETLTVRFKTPEICKQFHDTILKVQDQMSIEKTETQSSQISSKQIENKVEKKSDIVIDGGGNVKSKGFDDIFKPEAGSWTCMVCYVTNAIDKLYCVACDSPKDETLPSKGSISSNTAPIDKATFSFGFPITDENDPKLSLEQTATIPHAFAFNKSNITQKTITTKAATIPTTTLESTKHLKEQTTSIVQGFGDQFKTKPGSWACSVCYIINNGELMNCIACDAPKDDVVSKKEGNSNAEQKFSFGAKAPDNNNIENAKSNFDFTFGDDSVAKTYPFTFPKPLATSTTLSSIGNINTDASTSNIAQTLASNATGDIGESASNVLSLARKGFTFTFKPKSPGKPGKSPMKSGGGDADDDGDEGEYSDEEENSAHFTPVIPLPEKIEVKTGEEEEEILYTHRAKLYRFTEGEWKERGLGNVKILRHLVTKKLRVIMRREQVLKICLNHVLNEDVNYKRKDEKSWFFAVNDFSEEIMDLQKFTLHFKTEEITEDFMEAVKKALNGTASALETSIPETSVLKTNTSSNRKPPASALNISEESEKLAKDLMLPPEFFAAKLSCTGCRGCDTENFTFINSKNNEVFVSQEDTKNPLLPMEMPSLILNRQGGTLSLVFPAVPTTSATLSTSINFKKKLADAFTANANGIRKANETVTFKTGEQEPSKTVFTTNTLGSIFGSADENKTFFSGGAATNTTFTITNKTQAPSIFGGTGSVMTGTSIFGQKSSLFDSNKSVFGAGDSNKSIFDTSTRNSNPMTSNNSIFGKSFTSFTGFSPNKTDGSGGFVFGSVASAPVPQGSSIFGGFTTSINSGNANTGTFMDLSKTATATIDFASLAAKAPKDGKNYLTLGKSNVKSSTGVGEFLGLVNENDAFANCNKYLKDQKSIESNDNNNSENSANDPKKNNHSIIATEGGDNENSFNNDENYDPHYEPIIELPEEIVVKTGEEEELKLFGERATLFRWDSTDKAWKERGVGELKILYHPTRGTYRMLMRREQIYKLVLNHSIGVDFEFTNMNKNPKSFMWSCMNYGESSEGVLESLAVRFKKEELAERFSEKLKECIEASKKRNSEID